MDRIYFLCNKGGKTESEICKHIEENRKTRIKWLAFAKKHTGSEMVFAGNYFEGVEISNPENVPTNWFSPKKLGRSNVYKPKKGPDLKELKSLPRKLGADDFNDKLGINAQYSGCSIYWASYKQYGDNNILSLVQGMEVPDDVTELKMSEYYKIVEDCKNR